MQQTLPHTGGLYTRPKKDTRWDKMLVAQWRKILRLLFAYPQKIGTWISRRRRGIIGFLFLSWVGIEVTFHKVAHLPWTLNDPFVVVDPLVGRIPREGFGFRTPFYPAFAMTIEKHGVRSNGTGPPVLESQGILAVGDSFTFGEGESDSNTWPSLLEGLLRNTPVINAGVSGFGIDQSLLRAEQLVPIYKPKSIVVSFIPVDLDRAVTTYTNWSAKPYFALRKGEWVLQPAPAPARPVVQRVKQLLRNSLILNMMLGSLLRDSNAYRVDTGVDRNALGCHLMARLADLEKKGGAVVVVLAQMQTPFESERNRELKDQVLGCARAQGLRTLDLFPLIDELSARDRLKLFHVYGPNDFGHMNTRGNLLVARALEEVLK